MEYASFIAGERWTDHPGCTHPLLAGVARDVNDHMSDAGRFRLVPLIPSVVGLNGDDPRVDVGIAIRAATVALPVAAEPQQRALAAGLLAARQVFTDLDDSSSSKLDTTSLFEDSDHALICAPHAAGWAEKYVTGEPIVPKTFVRRSAPHIVRVAVSGIAEACIPDPDARLFDLLESAILDCSLWLGASPQSQPGWEVGSIPNLEADVAIT